MKFKSKILNKGMTLVEILVALSISALLVSSTLSFFISSSKSSNASQMNSESLHLLQSLSYSLNKHLRTIRPFDKGSFPVDFLGSSPKDGFKFQRTFNPSLRHDGPGFSRDKPLDPMIIEFQYNTDPSTNISQWSSTINADPFFEEPQNIMGLSVAQQQMLSFSSSSTTVLMDNDLEANVHEYMFWNGSQRIRYRHFKTSTDGKPLYFVTLDANEDPREDWSHVRTFGGINGEPMITKFRIKVNSKFRCVYYKNGNEWHGSDGSFYNISLGVSSPRKALIHKDNSFREVYRITYNLKDKGLLQNILSEEAGYSYMRQN